MAKPISHHLLSSGLTSGLPTMREVIDSANTAAFSSCSGLVAGKADRPEDLAQELTFSKAVGELLQLRVFRLSLLQDWNVMVGVFPQRQEILIRGAALGGVALQRIGTCELEMGQRADGFIQNNTTMVEDSLKLCRCFAAPMCGKIGFSSHIYGVQIRPIVKA